MKRAAPPPAAIDAPLLKRAHVTYDQHPKRQRDDDDDDQFLERGAKIGLKSRRVEVPEPPKAVKEEPPDCEDHHTHDSRQLHMHSPFNMSRVEWFS